MFMKSHQTLLRACKFQESVYCISALLTIHLDFLQPINHQPHNVNVSASHLTPEVKTQNVCWSHAPRPHGYLVIMYPSYSIFCLYSQ